MATKQETIKMRNPNINHVPHLKCKLLSVKRLCKNQILNIILKTAKQQLKKQKSEKSFIQNVQRCLWWDWDTVQMAQEVPNLEKYFL